MTDIPDREVAVPYDRFRRATARRLTASVVEKPHVTLHRHATMTSLERGMADARTRSDDIGLTGYLLRLVAFAMAGDNRVNGRVDDKVVTRARHVDLGVAVDVNGALMVPVIRGADTMSVAAIGRTLRGLSAAAREGRLRPSDVGGATFTVTSLGALGVEFFTPIINPPELAILGIGAVTEHVVLRGGAVTTERRIGLSLSFDHAATDGADAARVLAHLVSTLEQPPQVAWTDERLSGDTMSSAATEAAAP